MLILQIFTSKQLLCLELNESYFSPYGREGAGQVGPTERMCSQLRCQEGLSKAILEYMVYV